MAKKIDDIGKLFHKRRKELGLTQEQVAEKVGVSKSEISKIENGRPITFSTINKISEALNVATEVDLKSLSTTSSDIIHYIVMSLGMFARKYNLTKKEACNYLSRFKGLKFSIDNYEVEHQLSLEECVDDMRAICKQNGGIVG
ncbi:MAG: helix-turn-helix domain-containing protein [Bacteroides sp.]|nr:helix-turn-helix domain-containing protein [Bacteroides sp.]